MKAFGARFDPGDHLPRQSYTRADRPLAALVGILRALRQGRFTSFGVSDHWIMDEAMQRQVSVDRLERFAQSLDHNCRLFESAEAVPRDRVILPYALDEYQCTALAGMREVGGVLAMGCGLGKTVTAVAAALLAPCSRSRCWILCPVNAAATWEKVRPWLLQAYDTVEIVSIDQAHKVQALNPTPGGAIIYDEAHMLGDTGARRTKAAHTLRGAFEFGLALTGTLLHAGIGKALSVMDLAVPGLAGFTRTDDAADHFGCRYPQKIDMGGGNEKTVMKIDKPTGDNRERFLRYIDERVISMSFETKEVQSTVTVPQQHVYTIALGKPWDNLDDLAVEYIREQIEAGFEIPSAAEVAHALCRHNAEAKIEWLINAMDTPAQVVVGAVYHETLDLCEQAFEKHGITWVRIDGSVTGKHRAEAVRKFQAGEVQVFLGQIDAASTSVNLQNARISVALEHSWRAANYAQFLARTRRRGQHDETHHFDLISNTLQARVAARVADAADFDASLAEWQSIKRLRQDMLDSQ